MPTKIFLTGATGYIGGEALYSLYEAHPEFEYALLVRNADRGKPVAEQYPKARLVYGSLTDGEVIEKEAVAADIVIHTADSADDEPSARAIARGIAAGHSVNKPAVWIHVSGTGILQWYDQTHNRTGQPPLSEQTYRDIADIDRILTLPDQADHRPIDKLVLAANSSTAVRTTIVGPPTIYGTGRGPVNRTSQQVPALVRFVLREGYAPVIGTGRTEWDNVHVHDLGALFVLLVEAAVDEERRTDPELFGGRAYFFAESGVHIWSEVGRWIAAEAHKQGYLTEAKIKETTMEALKAAGAGAAPSWACNSHSVAERARKYLGWEPNGPSLQETIPEAVRAAAEELGLKPGQKSA